MSGPKITSAPAPSARSLARSGDNSLIGRVLELIRSHPGNAPKRQLLAKVEALRQTLAAPPAVISPAECKLTEDEIREISFPRGGEILTGPSVADCAARFPPPSAPRFYESLRTVLRRPDVQEAIAKGLCHHNGGDWAAATEAGRNSFRGEAGRLIEDSMAQRHEDLAREECPDCGRWVYAKNVLATGFLAPCGRRLSSFAQCGTRECPEALRS